jgi:hypothetical protein
MTQTVVPQTQIVQTGYNQATGSQITSYVQPQTGFIPSTTTAVTPSAYNNSLGATNGVVIQPQPTAPAYSASSNEPQLPQAAQNSNFRYVAAVPSTASNQSLLSRVRQYVPRAFLSNSGRGTYIHAGAYQNRDSAEAVSRYLRSQGVDSRVLYF